MEGNAHALVSGRDGIVDNIVTGVSMAVMARELQRAQSQPLPTLESYTLLMGAIALMHRLSLQDFDRFQANAASPDRTRSATGDTMGLDGQVACVASSAGMVR